MTRQECEEYVPEPEDKRTQAQWDALTLAELLTEWNSQPRFAGPPYPVDRNRYARLMKVRSEIYRRLNTRPPDGGTHGKGAAKAKS